MLRLVVADHQDLVRLGLCAVLAADEAIEVCAGASSLDQALDCTSRHSPQLIVLGPLAPTRDALQALALLGAAFPATRRLLLGRDRRAQAARESLALGAHGYALATDPARELLAAVRAVAARRPYVSPGVARGQGASREPWLACGPRGGEARLTRREREVLALVATGRRTREIAVVLGIGVKTVESHRMALMRKLDLHRLAEVVRYALAHELVAAP